MNIFDKIEEIRHQPEHIRLRWAWGMTAIFMVGVILLWIIILKSQSFEFSKEFPATNPGFSNEFDNQKKSIKDAMDQVKGAMNESNGASVPSSQSKGFMTGDGTDVTTKSN